MLQITVGLDFDLKVGGGGANRRDLQRLSFIKREILFFIKLKNSKLKVHLQAVENHRGGGGRNKTK